jgi:hypothetical protein
LGRARRPNPIHSALTQPRPARAHPGLGVASHGQHGLSTAAAFLGVRTTTRGRECPYKAAAKPPRVPCSQAAASTAPRHPCVRCRLHRAPPAATSIRRREVPLEQGDAALSSSGSSRTPSAVSRRSSNAGVPSPLKDRAEPPELRCRPILASPPRPCRR